MTSVRVELPVHLRALARLDSEIAVDVVGEPTIRNVLDAIESRYPMLKGTIRDHGSGQRRAYIRYFAGGEDISHESPEARLPDVVVSGADAIRVIGAISGG